MIPNNAPPEGNKTKKKRRPKAVDDIIEAIILVIAERESSNYQRMTQVIAQSDQLKLALKILEACICTLTAENSKDEDGMIIRQTHAATMLRDVLDTVNSTNWGRMELKEKVDNHMQKYAER